MAATVDPLTPPWRGNDEVAAIHTRYAREMHDRFGQFASWPPNTPLQLGDVGVLRRDRFDKTTTLTDLGVRFTPDRTGEPVLLEYSSANQVRLSVDGDVQAAATIAPVASKISISFGREGATFFQAVEAVRDSVADVRQLEKDLRPLMARRIWRPEWAVVTSVQRTGPAIILVSGRRDASLELTVGADALGPAIPLAAAAARIGFGATNDVAIRVVAPHGATPLFGAAQFRRRQNTLTFRAGRLGLTELGWDDLTWDDPDAAE